MSSNREGLAPKSRRLPRRVAEMKKLINDVAEVVPDMLDGLAALNPGLSLLQGSTIIVRADAEAAAARGEVALISGGGSGHEPAHGGYVGPGILSAAVAGEVFTSPSTDAVLDCNPRRGQSRGRPSYRQKLHGRPLQFRPCRG